MLVALVGRTNVGKSTLFNRLLGHSRSIVHDEPNVTRDLIEASLNHLDRTVKLVDTGGYTPLRGASDIQQGVDEKVHQVLKAADLLLFVVDARSGLAAGDQEMVERLRPLGKKTWLVLNKVDPGAKNLPTHEFNRLGIQKSFEVSSEHRIGVETLKEEIFNILKGEVQTTIGKEDRVSVAFVGRPNVGKSSLINRMLHEPRLLVSEKPGTTRDVVDIMVEQGERRFRLLDTAGIRRRPKIEETVEHFSVSRSLGAIERAEIVVLVLDAQDNITTQDERIAAEIVERGKGLLIVANKWDLLSDRPQVRNEFREEVYYRAAFLRFASLRFASAKSGLGVDQVLADAWRIRNRMRKRFDQNELNVAFDSVFHSHTLTGKAGSRLRIERLSQSEENGVPTFFVWCNDPRLVTTDYERFWRNALGELLGLEGVPLKVTFRRSLGRRRKPKKR